jgi:hypothetical protein
MMVFRLSMSLHTSLVVARPVLSEGVKATTLIESTEAELQEVKHDQNVLRDQNENLHEEVRALLWPMIWSGPPVGGFRFVFAAL